MIAKNAFTYCRPGEIYKVENYEEAVKSPDFWECHHRLEITLGGERALSYVELRRHKMYYRRPPFELIFLPREEHKKLHWAADGCERRQKASARAVHGWHKNHAKWRNTLSQSNRARAEDPEIRQKLQAATLSVMSRPERKQVYLDAQEEKKSAYRIYKLNGGPLMWNDWAREIYALRPGGIRDFKRKRSMRYESLQTGGF